MGRRRDSKSRRVGFDTRIPCNYETLRQGRDAETRRALRHVRAARVGEGRAMNRTLLLNATYEPLTVIDWRKAITMLVLQKVETLAHYDHEIRSSKRAMPLPAVVRLHSRVPWRKPSVRFNRRHVFARDRFTCQYCGQRSNSAELTFDHVLPRSHGGPTNWTNIVTSCVPCNQIKGDRTPERAGMKLMRKPFAPYWITHHGREEATEAPTLWEPYLW